MDNEAVRDRLSSQLFAPHDEEFLRAIEEGTAGTSIREDLEVDPDSILEDVRAAREEFGQVNQTPQFGDLFGSLTGGFGGLRWSLWRVPNVYRWNPQILGHPRPAVPATLKTSNAVQHWLP